MVCMSSLCMGHPINGFNFIQLFVCTPKFLLSTVFTTMGSSLHQGTLYPSLRLHSPTPLPGILNPPCFVCQDSDEIILPSLIFCSLLFLYPLKCLHKIIILIYICIYIYSNSLIYAAIISSTKLWIHMFVYILIPRVTLSKNIDLESSD